MLSRGLAIFQNCSEMVTGNNPYTVQFLVNIMTNNNLVLYDILCGYDKCCIDHYDYAQDIHPIQIIYPMTYKIHNIGLQTGTCDRCPIP